MAGSRPSFQKRQKEQQRREKQRAKQERKAQRKLEKPATDEFGNPIETVESEDTPEGNGDAGESDNAAAPDAGESPTS